VQGGVSENIQSSEFVSSLYWQQEKLLTKGGI
jgi:hypothetical protein